MEKYAIFIDIDGTILPKHADVPKENVRAMKEAISKGHYVFINTGRSYEYIPDEIKNGLPISGIVAALGTNIIFENKVVKSVVLDKEDLKRIYRIIEKTDTSCIYEGENMLVWQGQNSKKIWSCATEEFILTSEKEFDTKFAAARISKTSVLPKPSKEIIDGIKKMFYVIEMPKYIEIVSKGYSKGVGMIETIGMLGIKRENCIAIGDSENDLDMMRAAGISVAMGNSPDGVKKECDFVTLPCEDGGVAYAIDKLVLKK